MSETGDSTESPSQNAGNARYFAAFQRAAIWCLFGGLVYLTRDFFFTAFATFLFCYMSLAVVDRLMKVLSPDRDNPGLRRVATLAVFLVVPLMLLIIGFVVAPRVISQGQQLASWLGQVSPESEVARILEGLVGPSEFNRKYRNAKDETYRKELAEFKASKLLHVQAYNDFPNLSSWVEGGFERQYADSETGRIRARLLMEGTSSRDFAEWFLIEKAPSLQDQAKLLAAQNELGKESTPTLVRAAAKATPEQLLEMARRDRVQLPVLQQQWIDQTVERAISTVRTSPKYKEQFRVYYDAQRKAAPKLVPYTYDEYIELQKARLQGGQAFGDALEKMRPTKDAKNDTQLLKDFKAAKTHELFQAWWGNNAIAKFVRQEVESLGQGAGAGHMERMVAKLIHVPMDLATALLLSFFICIDYPKLKRAVQLLRETWLKDVYAEVAPVLSRLAILVGRSLHAQGLIAFCNAMTILIALPILGVEHAFLLSFAVFVLCLIPTLGMVLAWVLIAGIAVVQPGGGVGLAVKVTGLVAFVVLMETFVFSPRILGRMMELHPVLIIAVLPLAQYFFGVWGLVLATPVAVYVVHVVILRQSLPGIDEARPEGSGPNEPKLNSSNQLEKSLTH